MKKMMKSLMAGLMATGCLIAYGETQTADGPEMYTDMIRLKYADADDVTRMCNNVVNTNLVRFRPDRRCNTIIVTAPKTDLATIKRVLCGMGWMMLWIFLWSLIPIVGIVFGIIRTYEYRPTWPPSPSGA